MKRSIILSLVLVSVLSVSSLFAQRPGRMAKDGKPGVVMAKLDLTDEQQTQIDKLHLEHQKTMTPLRDEVRSLVSEYKLMIIDEKISESALTKQAVKIADKKAAMQVLRAKHQRQVRNLLTDEQKVKFDQHILAGPGKMGCSKGMDSKPGMSRKAGRRMR